MSIRELAATARSVPEPANGCGPAPSPATLRPRLAWLDTSIVLRSPASTMVVLVHLEIWGVRGGAHLLLAIAGFTDLPHPLGPLAFTAQPAGAAAAPCPPGLPAGGDDHGRRRDHRSAERHPRLARYPDIPAPRPNWDPIRHHSPRSGCDALIGRFDRCFRDDDVGHGTLLALGTKGPKPVRE
jgi:hypothetical protein